MDNTFFILTGTRALTYNRNIDHGFNTASIQTLKRFVAGDVLKVNVIKNNDSSTIKTYSEGSRILIESIERM